MAFSARDPPHKVPINHYSPRCSRAVPPSQEIGGEVSLGSTTAGRPGDHDVRHAHDPSHGSRGRATMTINETADRPVTDADVRPGLTLAVVAVVQFMVSLDLSVVNVGLP